VTIKAAMIMAAGMGTRMRPLTLDKPKPLIQVGGRTLFDHALDQLPPAGIDTAVVNVHYLPEQIEAFAETRSDIDIHISDERGQLLDTGGGIKKALPLLGDCFAVLNSDNVWKDNGVPALAQLMPHWNAESMDSLLLLARREEAVGYTRAGDFELRNDGRLSWRQGETAPYVYASLYITRAEIFDALPEGPVSTLEAWRSSIAKGRVFGHVFDGIWCDIGTPQAIAPAEAVLAGYR
jgi:N-acetyl-alpha-D-muramate 1-phosphate uridylyltransferase